jgi:hypothetical protein
MLRLIRLFLHIAVFRETPAAVPASGLLLAIACVALALVEIGAANLPGSGSGGLPARVLISVGLPLLWTWILLALAGRRSRFLQAGTALAAILTLGGMVLYPLNALAQSYSETDPRYAIAAFVVLVFFTWQLLACSNVWRASLEVGWMLAIALAIAYVPLEFYVSKLFSVGS